MWRSRSLWRDGLRGVAATAASNVSHRQSPRRVCDNYHPASQDCIPFVPGIITNVAQFHINRSLNKKPPKRPSRPRRGGEGEDHLGLKQHELLDEEVVFWNSVVKFQHPLGKSELTRAVRVAHDEMMQGVHKLRANGINAPAPLTMTAYVQKAMPDTVVFSSSLKSPMDKLVKNGFYFTSGHKYLKDLLKVVGRYETIGGGGFLGLRAAGGCGEIGAINIAFMLHSSLAQTPLEGNIVTYGRRNNELNRDPRFMGPCHRSSKQPIWACHQLLQKCEIKAIEPREAKQSDSLPPILERKRVNWKDQAVE
ncbi:hypothetical protein F4777DRAFT_597862 [Nemania sp. FL0916]|nr:hypothetical protein F4777DRAFT_597862 [Nemania sp. FL0916]